jgi:hypothetical protein
MDKTKSNAPEGFKITGNWEKRSKQLKHKFSQLTDADLKYETGKDEELLKRLETRLNKRREEVINIIRKEEPSTV